MLKALEILRRAKTHFFTHAKINEAIEELEEIIKPKSCSTCRYLFIENENILECSKLDITQVEEDFYCKYFKLKEQL